MGEGSISIVMWSLTHAWAIDCTLSRLRSYIFHIEQVPSKSVRAALPEAADVAIDTWAKQGAAVVAR
jgi:hypothetical protein